MASEREIRRALEYLGWEVRWEAHAEANAPASVVGGYGPYRLVVRLDPDTGTPTSVVTHRVGDQGMFVQGWRGVERLSAPEEVVRRLSKRGAGRS